MRLYPRTVWVLTPKFETKQVTLVSPYKSYVHQGYDVTANGKAYHLSEVYDTEAIAIEDGHRRIKKQLTDLAGRQRKIEQRLANLIKCETTYKEKNP